MRTYEQLRRDRFDRNLQKYQSLIEVIESEYLKVSSVRKTGDDTEINAHITLNTNLTPDLIVLLSDYIWLTGIPLTVTEGEGKTYILIRETAYTKKG